MIKPVTNACIAFQGMLGLLSLLPPPMSGGTKEAGRPLVPHSVSKRQQPAAAPVVPSSSKSSSVFATNVSRSIPAKPATKTTQQVPVVGRPVVSAYTSDDEDEDEDANNFFSISKEKNNTISVPVSLENDVHHVEDHVEDPWSSAVNIDEATAVKVGECADDNRGNADNGGLEGLSAPDDVPLQFQSSSSPFAIGSWNTSQTTGPLRSAAWYSSSYGEGSSTSPPSSYGHVHKSGDKLVEII